MISSFWESACRLLAQNGEILLNVTTGDSIGLDVPSLFGELLELKQPSVYEHPLLGHFHRLTAGVNGLRGTTSDLEEKILYLLKPRHTICDDSSVVSILTSTYTTERETQDRNRLNYDETNRLNATVVCIATHGVMTEEKIEVASYDLIQVRPFNHHGQ